jgi:hypothetical protein
MNNIEQLIKKISLILGVSENMVMFNLSTEKQIEMLVEQNNVYTANVCLA